MQQIHVETGFVCFLPWRGVAVARQVGCVAHASGCCHSGGNQTSQPPHPLSEWTAEARLCRIWHRAFDEASTIRMTGAAESMCSLVIVGMASPHGSKGGPIYGPRVQRVRSSSRISADLSRGRGACDSEGFALVPMATGWWQRQCATRTPGR